MIDTVLMDLDGTLLPFEQDDFLKAYFGLLCQKLCPLGYEADTVIKALWHGTKCMIQSDGANENAVRFWDAFAAVLGEDIRKAETMLDRFYGEEFHEVRRVVKGDSPAASIVRTLKDKGYTVVLATNPLFPDVAQESRLSWIELTPSDFALVTHYGNSRFCKPDPRYYREVLDKLGKSPDQCWMLGNSVEEDMIPASTLGMHTFLVPTHLENPNGLSTDAYRQGSLDDFAREIATWPTV